MFLLTGIRALGTYVTISGSVAVYATAYDYTYVLVVRAYAYCHLSGYIMSVMSYTLVLSP
jgi:hypothetical protein